jgi:membrane protein implicated in regulation of membrane protease activity
MDIAWPTAVVFWHWWIFGGLMLVLELLAPGIFFLWTGLAAGLTGLVVFFFPSMAWEIQALLFAVLALATTFAGRRIWRPGAVPTDHPMLNRRAHRHVGRVVALTTPLGDSGARVRVDDSEWSAVGETVGLSAPAGAAVKVVGVRDGLLVVAPMDSETAPGVGAADPSGSGTP